MGLIDKNKLEQFYESGTDPLDTWDIWPDMVYIRAEHIDDVPEVDAAKIQKLCNEIEDIAQDIKARTMSDSYFQAQSIIDKAKEIGKELTGNADDRQAESD